MACALAAASLFAQGTVGTNDGLALTLSAAGGVQSLQLGGVEYASSALSSGFAWRELPAAGTDVAPNGSFESGSVGPGSWSWSNNANGTWTWDGTVAADGARSLRVDVPAGMPRRSPLLSSDEVAIRPNTPYTMSCRIRTLDLSTHLDVYVVERDTAGQVIQRGVTSASGTTDWQSRSLTFVAGPAAASAYFRVEIFSGTGTAWLDDVALVDVYAGRSPALFGGTVETRGAAVTQSASASDLTLAATFTPAGPAIRVDATLTDTSGADRAIELSFHLPVDALGWNWDQDPATSIPIADRVRYENLDATFGAQSHSVYPFAAIRNASAAVALATPLVPQINRFAYDRLGGFRVTWDVGLSAAAKTASQAAVTFWIFAPSPRWGFRSAVDRYYQLQPEAFVSPLPAAAGAWVIYASGSLAAVPKFSDFGWGLLEGVNDIDFGNANDLLVYHYVDAGGWFRSFPGYSSQPSYDVLVAALQSDAASGTGEDDDGVPTQEMAQATINSSPKDASDRYQLFANSYFWFGNRLQIYPTSPDPDIPAPSMWSVLTKYRVDDQISIARDLGQHLDGIFLDDVTSNFAGVENFRRDLWALSDTPLSTSWDSGGPTLLNGASMAKFLAALRSYVHARGLTLMGSLNAGVYAWFAPSLDAMGGESAGADSLERSYVRRVLGNGRPWSNLYVPTDGQTPSAASVLAYLRQALFFGYFPGLNGAYWKVPSAYERDRPLFVKYVPLIRTIVSAGWRPISGATASNPAVLVERFDDGRGGVFYLTAANSGASAAPVQIDLDPATLGIGDGAVTVQELVRGQSVPAARVGGAVRLTDTLAPGETLLYKVQSNRSSSPGRSPTRNVGPRG